MRAERFSLPYNVRADSGSLELNDDSITKTDYIGCGLLMLVALGLVFPYSIFGPLTFVSWAVLLFLVYPEPFVLIPYLIGSGGVLPPVVDARKAWKPGGIKQLRVGSEEFAPEPNPIAKPFLGVMALVFIALGISAFVFDQSGKFIIGPLVIGFGIYFLTLAFAPQQIITATADGITVKAGGKSKSIPWNEVVLFHTRIPHRMNKKIYYVFTVKEKIVFDDSYERADRLAALVELAMNTPAR